MLVWFGCVSAKVWFSAHLINRVAIMTAITKLTIAPTFTFIGMNCKRVWVLEGGFIFVCTSALINVRSSLCISSKYLPNIVTSWQISDKYFLSPSKSLISCGAHSTNDFYPQFQFNRNSALLFFPLLANRSQQIFAHVTTAVSCHVQNVVSITAWESIWEWNEISIEFQLRWKNR